MIPNIKKSSQRGSSYNAGDSIVISIDDDHIDQNNFTKELSKDRYGIPSTFLQQHGNQIENLIYYYQWHRLKGTQINDFFHINFHIFQFIFNNLNEMDQFVKDYTNKYDIDYDTISYLWIQLQEFLIYYFTKDTNVDNIRRLDKHFREFLMALVDEEVANQNRIDKYYFKTISDSRSKMPRSVEEFARAFIILILDMPAHVVFLNDELPIIKLKIYSVEMKYYFFNNDIIYVFSHEDSDFEADKMSSKLTEKQAKGLEQFCEHELLLKRKKIQKYYSKIRSQLNLQKYKRLRCLRLANLRKSSWMVSLKLLLSFLSVVDISLDIVVAYKFFKSGEMVYGILTVSILINVGVINIIFEWQYLKKVKCASNYLPERLNSVPLRYICSFLQLSAFLSILKATIISIRTRKEKQVETLLKIIFQSNAGHLQIENQTLKFLETYLEALPQILLQIHVISANKQWTWVQLSLIVGGVANIYFNTISFQAMIKNMDFIDIWRHPCFILKIFFYSGFLIICCILLFWQFH